MGVKALIVVNSRLTLLVFIFINYFFCHVITISVCPQLRFSVIF